MKYAVLITGSGGQGVLSAGMSLAASAANLAHASYVPWYGAAQRGGVARCSVVLSDEPILSPLPGLYNAIIAMTESACQKSLGELKHGGLIIRNSNRCSDRISADAILVDVPADGGNPVRLDGFVHPSLLVSVHRRAGKPEFTFKRAYPAESRVSQQTVHIICPPVNG